MKSSILKSLRLLIVLMLSGLGATALVHGESAQAGDLTTDFSSIGAPGPKAISFKVWANKPKGEAFMPGERAVMNFTVEQEGFLTILYFSSDGAITVVAPSELIPETKVRPEAQYTLFGDDRPIRMILEKESSEAKIMVYLTSTPFELDPLRIPKGKKWLVIPPTAHQEIAVLRDKLTAMGRDETFNRYKISFQDDAGVSLGIKLQTVFSTMAPKAIPGGLESSPPETLTGAAGVKPPSAGDSKE